MHFLETESRYTYYGTHTLTKIAMKLTTKKEAKEVIPLLSLRKRLPNRWDLFILLMPTQKQLVEPARVGACRTQIPLFLLTGSISYILTSPA